MNIKEIMKSKRMVTFFSVFLFVIIISTSTIFAYNSYEYKKYYKQGTDFEQKDDLDKAIENFNKAGKYNKGKISDIKHQLQLIETIKLSKSNFENATSLMNEKKYLEAIELLKKVSKDDQVRYKASQDKNNQCRELYIKENIDKSKTEAEGSRYIEAIAILDTIISFDSNNNEAVLLKEDYNKKIAVAKEAEKKKAEEAAKKLAEAAKQPVLKAPSQPNVSNNNNTATDTKINQVQGRDAIKKEFSKIGFVFNSDTTAMYSKDNIQVGILDRGDYWQVSTKVWGNKVQDIFEYTLIVIWGNDTAWNNLIYLDYAMENPGSVFKSPNIETFVSDGKLVMKIFLKK